MSLTLSGPINSHLCAPERLLWWQNLNLLAEACWPACPQHIKNGGASTFCLLVSKSQCLPWSQWLLWVSKGRSRFILFVKHLALGWQGTTDFQEPVARAAALHHALQAASRPIFICTSWDHYSNFLDDVLTGISVLAWRFLAKGRCQPKKQQQQLTITKKGFWL